VHVVQQSELGIYSFDFGKVLYGKRIYIALVKLLFKGVEIVVCINGNITKTFIIEKDVTQG
jgi:hypothetical protein